MYSPLNTGYKPGVHISSLLLVVVYVVHKHISKLYFDSGVCVCVCVFDKAKTVDLIVFERDIPTACEIKKKT